MNFNPLAKFARLQTDGAQNQIQPLISAELAASFTIADEVEAAQLDRPQILHIKGVIIILDVVVGNYYLRPYPAFQEPVIVFVIFLVDGDTLRVKILQGCPVPLFFLHITHMHLVYETVFPPGCDLGLGCIRFVWSDIIVLECHKHGIHPRVYFRLVAACTIAGKQKLQHERWDR